MKIPKIISQKTVLKTHIIDVMETEIQLPAGQHIIHHNVYRVPTVSVFPLTPKGEIYLVSQYRYLYEKVTLEAMSGFIEKGEDPLDAGKRELKEETGIIAKQWQSLLDLDIAASVLKSRLHLYLAKDLTMGETSFDDDEDIELIKLSLDEAVEKVIRGEVNHASSAAGILLLDKFQKEGKL